MSTHEPTASRVPDDRIHGDSLPGEPVRGAEAFGDSWLRPTLTTERAQTPPEAPAPPTPSARPWWLVAGLGATLVLASVAGVTSWGAVTGGLWGSADQQQTYEQNVDTLTISGGASDVQIRGGGEAGKVGVSRHLSWGPGSGEPTPRESWNGSTLTVDAECGGVLGWCSIDYVITIPDRTDVSVDIGSGDITVNGTLGDVTLTAGSGDIGTTDLDAERVTAEAKSGDIDLGLGSAASPVSVRTGSGDVSVRLPQSSRYAVDAEASSGEADVNVATDPASTKTLQVRTGSGDISVDDR